MLWLIDKIKDPIVLVFFISSCVTIFLAYERMKITTYQQIIAALIVAILVLYSHFLAPSKHLNQVNPRLKNILNLSTLFASSLFVQLLVLSSGGIKSPFLVIFYLYALTLSFQISVRASLSFLIFATLFLIANIIIHPFQQRFFREDPGTALLYLVAFFGTIHLAHFISTTYHIKSELYKVLAWQMKIDESILTHLKEQIFVTNRQLQVVYANQSAIQMLNLAENKIYGEKLFNLISFKEESGQPLVSDNLMIDKIIDQKAVRVIKDLIFELPNQNSSTKANLQILPIPNPSGLIDQIAFIISI